MLFTSFEYGTIGICYDYFSLPIQHSPPPFVLFFPIDIFVMDSLLSQPQTFLRYMKFITDLKPVVIC